MIESEKEYVLGTHDDEVARLGLQHRAWQPNMFSAWQTAEIGSGQTVLDVGCGPGYATLDLARLVGNSGCVLAVDKSRRFLDVLDKMRRQYELLNISVHQADFDEGEFPPVTADRVWCRWVFAFTRNPREVLARVARAMASHSAIVIHEYFDYATWRSMPQCPELEEFVNAVMASWREHGGEPDIALSLPGWLEGLGFELRSVRPIVDVVERGEMKWEWLKTFIDVGRQRLVDLGYMTATRSAAVWEAFAAIEDAPGTRMITPGVMEIVATGKLISRAMG